MSVAVTLLVAGAVSGVAAAAEKPFIAPVQTDIIRGFDRPSNPFGPGHRGIDFGVPSETSVRASGAGTVSFAGPVADDLFVTVEHPGGISTTYSFLSRVDVSRGDSVAQGQVIGASGGHPGGPAGLHFGAKRNGDYIDPSLLLADFEDISDLLQLQPANDRSDSGNGAFRAMPAAAVVGPDIISGPSGVPGLPLTPPGFAPVLEPENPGPVDRKGPNVTGALPATVPGNLEPPDGHGGTGSEERSAHFIPTAGRPEEVATWWSGLSEEERARLIENEYSRIGRLEGLPATVRNAANRNLLEKEIDNLQRERAAATRELRDLEGRYGSDYVEYGSHQAEIRSVRERVASLKRRLRNARHLRDSLARVESKPGDGLAPDQILLLDFDTAFAGDEGRAVVALGNPDTAENVGVVVPGVVSTNVVYDGEASSQIP